MDPIFPGSYKYDAKHWANVHHHINQMEKVDRLTFFEVGMIMKNIFWDSATFNNLHYT